MRAGSLFIVAALSVLLCSCAGPDSRFYALEGGDPSVDWIEFADDGTLLWVGPGGITERSPYEETPDGEIVVRVAPFSRGRLRRVDQRTLQGDAPFFEGTWKKAKPRR